MPSGIVRMITFHFRASRFEPDVGQDSDEERVLRKKALQVCCMSCKVLYFCVSILFCFPDILLQERRKKRRQKKQASAFWCEIVDTWSLTSCFADTRAAVKLHFRLMTSCRFTPKHVLTPASTFHMSSRSGYLPLPPAAEVIRKQHVVVAPLNQIMAPNVAARGGRAL